MLLHIKCRFCRPRFEKSRARYLWFSLIKRNRNGTIWWEPNITNLLRCPQSIYNERYGTEYYLYRLLLVIRIVWSFKGVSTLTIAFGNWKCWLSLNIYLLLKSQARIVFLTYLILLMEILVFLGLDFLVFLLGYIFVNF